MATLTGNKPAVKKLHHLVKNQDCKWCGKPAKGFAMRGMGDWKLSCGEHGQLFQLVPPGHRD